MSIGTDRLTAARWVGAYLVGTLLLLWVAIANGYPLVFTDSGTYLRIGTELYLPDDRPITYGVAMLPLHRLFGLWGVAAAQSLLLVWLLDLTFSTVLGRRDPRLLVAAAAVLALLTGLPWFTGQLMPDIMVGAAALLVFAIIFGPSPFGRYRRWILPLALLALIAMHLSFPLTIAGIAVVVGGFGWALTRRAEPVKRAGIVIAATIVAMLGFSSFNLVVRGEFKPSTMSSSFLLARLLDGGLAQPSLAGLCRTERLALCRLQPELDPVRPDRGQAYLWENVRGKLTPAELAQIPAEEKKLIDRTLAEHPAALARDIVAGIGRQIVQSGVGDGMMVQAPGNQIYQQIVRHFPREAPAWLASREQQGTVLDLVIVPERAIGLIAALIDIVLLVVAIRRRDVPLAGLAATVLATLLVNAVLCSALSAVNERYQSRILWMALLPIIAALALARKPPLKIS